MKVFQELAKRISEIAAGARTEEDLKMGIEPLIKDHLSKQKGIEIIPRYEVTDLCGRRDAVYGHFTLEYKKPGELSVKEKLEKAAKQLAGYLEGAAEKGEEKGEEALKRVAGACIDGEKLFIMRYWPSELSRTRPYKPKRQLSLIETELGEAKGGFQLLGPFPITPESLDELFRYLRALYRRPLSPELLTEEFGPGTEMARSLIGTFYQALLGKGSGMAKTLFEEWEHTFGVIYGEETAQIKKDTPELIKGYDLPEDAGLKHSLFVVHTYFALIMKLIAAEVLSLQQGSLTPSFIVQFIALPPAQLKKQMGELENGGIFGAYGIVNFLEGDFFRWYLSVWNDDIAAAIRQLVIKLSDFEPTAPVLRPGEARDLLKKLYQYLVPKKLRHDLGEYYTPDWIAERLLNQLGYDGNPDIRLLDPACGSGTFLTLAIDRVRLYLEEKLWNRNPQKRKESAEKILRNIVGFDLNPLAVIAARTNYLLAFGDFMRDVRPIEIPVYICDSILTPVLQKQAQKQQLSLVDKKEDYFYLPTSAGNFIMPKEVLNRGVLEQVTTIIEECVKSGYNSKEFMSRMKHEIALNSEGSYSLLGELYVKILDLDKKGKNGIWARLLKNSFAPVLQEPFDLIAGNPPWVNWESLSPEWRELSKNLWVNYGLFSLKGHEARLGGGKKDLAMLFLYTCADHYLKPKGRLGFVITQTLFKTKAAGDGFRRFRLGERGAPLRVLHVDDMSELQPFEGATNRTAIIVLQKGEATRYPVPYTLWQKKEQGRIPLESSLHDAASRTQSIYLEAVPVDDKPASPWLTVRPQDRRVFQKMIGKSDYRAYAGACTWLNGVYWVRILEQRPDGLVIIENFHDLGKIKVPKVQAAIEPDLLYPLLRGGDINRWEATPSACIILAQNPETRAGWPEDKMKTGWPHSFNYLKRFEKLLRNRSGYIKYFNPQNDPFWCMYNVGPYTLSPFKVSWQRMGNTFCAVTLPTIPMEKKIKDNCPIIPQETVVFIPCATVKEAYYLTGVLNSSLAQLLVISYGTRGGKSLASTDLPRVINLPAYEPDNSIQDAIALLSEKAHEPVKRGGKETIEEIENALDHAVAGLWGISNKELSAIQGSLKELILRRKPGTVLDLN